MYYCSFIFSLFEIPSAKLAVLGLREFCFWWLSIRDWWLERRGCHDSGQLFKNRVVRYVANFWRATTPASPANSFKGEQERFWVRLLFRFFRVLGCVVALGTRGICSAHLLVQSLWCCCSLSRLAVQYCLALTPTFFLLARINIVSSPPSFVQEAHYNSARQERGRSSNNNNTQGKKRESPDSKHTHKSRPCLLSRNKRSYTQVLQATTTSSCISTHN